MAYSRWSDSCWYVYWEAQRPEVHTLEGQRLAVWYCGIGCRSLTFAEVEGALEREDLSIVAEVNRLGPRLSDKLPERATLKACFEEWIRDMRAKFPAAPAGAGSDDGGAS